MINSSTWLSIRFGPRFPKFSFDFLPSNIVEHINNALNLYYYCVPVIEAVPNFIISFIVIE